LFELIEFKPEAKPFMNALNVHLLKYLGIIIVSKTSQAQEILSWLCQSEMPSSTSARATKPRFDIRIWALDRMSQAECAPPPSFYSALDRSLQDKDLQHNQLVQPIDLLAFAPKYRSVISKA
jgi:hypothetical protein